MLKLRAMVSAEFRTRREQVFDAPALEAGVVFCEPLASDVDEDDYRRDSDVCSLTKLDVFPHRSSCLVDVHGLGRAHGAGIERACAR